MPQNVRSYVLRGYGWACPGGCSSVLVEEAFDGVAAEAGAAPGREQRVGRGAAAFGEPVTQDGRGGGGERGRAFLAALTVAGHVRAGAEIGGADGETGQLGDPKAGLDANCQQGVIAAAGQVADSGAASSALISCRVRKQTVG